MTQRSPLRLANDAWRLIEAAQRVANSAANSLDLVQVYIDDQYEDYFDGPVVVVGNWNSITRYDQVARKFDTIDDTPRRLGEALEKIGVELAWSDCVITCDGCGKLLNTNPDSYDWTPSYLETEEGVSCEACADFPAYLEELEGNPRTAVNNDAVDPSEYGYFRIEEELENGFHRGQDADPKQIAKALEKRGLSRFLFKIDDKGQFDLRFSVWLHEDEREIWEGAEALTDKDIDGPSNADALDRGLREASKALEKLTADSGQPTEGVRYVAIRGDTVTDARVISPQDFVEKGIK